MESLPASYIHYTRRSIRFCQGYAGVGRINCCPGSPATAGGRGLTCLTVAMGDATGKDNGGKTELIIRM